MSKIRQPTYSDISTSFGKSVISGDVLKVVDSEAVKRSIRNLIFTRKYERLIDPKIGADIQSFLFEPIDALTSMSIKKAIETTIKNYEPRANLQQVVVRADYEKQRYFVSVEFSVLNSSVQNTVELFLDRIR
jgi:phage baseplate assembly protein W